MPQRRAQRRPLGKQLGSWPLITHGMHSHMAPLPN